MPKLRDEVSAVADRVLAEKWCRSCTRHQDQDGGKYVLMANGYKRWKCAECREKGKQARLARHK